jgi:hypothetical protein
VGKKRPRDPDRMQFRAIAIARCVLPERACFSEISAFDADEALRLVLALERRGRLIRRENPRRAENPISLLPRFPKPALSGLDATGHYRVFSFRVILRGETPNVIDLRSFPGRSYRHSLTNKDSRSGHGLRSLVVGSNPAFFQLSVTLSELGRHGAIKTNT